MDLPDALAPRSLGLLAAVLALATGTAPAAPAAAVEPSVRITPDLYPAFDRGISDYVTHCPRGSVRVEVRAAASDPVAVDGEPYRAGIFTEEVRLTPGQAFELRSGRGGAARTHHVRCLPPDFPGWDFERLGRPHAQFFAIAPTGRQWRIERISWIAELRHWLYTHGPNPVRRRTYVIVFDRRGVPVWWYREGSVFPSDVTPLGDGTLAWVRTGGGPYEIRRLDGSLVRRVSHVGVETDPHDLGLLPNGNFLTLGYRRRGPVDLSAFGGSRTAEVIDGEIQEHDRNGEVVWSWNTKDHIRIEEMGRWLLFRPVWGPRLAFDLVHINSVAPMGDSLLVSVRHTDAVYSIDRGSGKVEWKLGGTPTKKSLTVRRDPFGFYPFGAQHDVQVLPDGTVTVYDNATFLGRLPRAVRYRINPVTRTATMLEMVSSIDVPESLCCGGATRSPDGSWLITWGGVSLVTEIAPPPDRSPTVKFRFAGPSPYRAAPIPPGTFSRAELRAGMSAQFPR